MNLDKIDIKLVETCIFALDGGAMFGVIPKALWSKVYDKGDEFNRIPLSARPLLVKAGDKTILIDTGNGDKLNDKIANLYAIDKEKSSMKIALKPFGISPEDITDVILTHLHFDHSGGAVSRINGELAPTFPNAKYYVQKEHFDWAKNPSEKDRASFMPENYMPLFDNGVLELLDGPGEIFPGIELIPCYGHTKAMQLVKISGGGNTVLYCADLAPTAAHIGTPYVMGYDNYPMTTIDEKKKIFSQAYEEKWILCYEHDAFVEATTLALSDKGFVRGDNVKINI